MEPSNTQPSDDANVAQPNLPDTLPQLTHFRRFTAHPNYRRIAPWLSFLRRFGPLLTALSLIVSAISALITGIGVKQSRDIYLRSLQPVLAISIGPWQKDGPGRQIIVSNQSGADAHKVRLGCLRAPAWTSPYATLPIQMSAIEQEIARNTVNPYPIEPDCPQFDAGPQPANFAQSNAESVILPFVICYRDERDKPHGIARLYSYKPRDQIYQIIPLGSSLGQEVERVAKLQCGVPALTS